MALPTYNEFFHDALTEEQIDAVHARWDLERLQELARLNNNDSLPEDVINVNLDKIGLILSLWMREVEIPTDLTWGEPYDSAFKIYLNKEFNIFVLNNNEGYPIPINVALYWMLKEPNYLVGYLGGALNINKVDSEANLDSHFYIERINDALIKINLPPITGYTDLRKRLKTFVPLVLVYLAASVPYAFTEDTPLDGYIDLCT
jgi:hypothetical protein